MRLSEGSRLGAYRITRFVASGGMGGVYEAVHTELGRRVAIKVLGEGIDHDPTSLARFRREARAASRLTHPHICTVHDFGQENETPYLVLEYLEGETLAERLRRGRPPLRETLRYGAEIAEALHHAHEHGFVHRDLKPGNIVLTETGAKVLDFGLVKRSGGPAGAREKELEPDESLTRKGTIVGTLPYMAPEQVEEDAIDARADIYALGAVLFEMVTGRPPARGRTRAALIADILQGDPIPILEREGSPPDGLVHVIRRCLHKEPAERWQNARDVAIELRWIAKERMRGGPGAAVESSPARGTGLRWIGGMALGAVVLIAGLFLLPSGTESGSAVIHFTLDPPPGVAFTEGARNVPAVAPDGESVAFIGTSADGTPQLWIHPLGETRARPLRGTTAAITPFWSPDGDALGFFTGTSLSVVPLSGGTPRRLAKVSPENRGGSWSARGDILFAPRAQGGIFRVPAAGGEVEPVTTPDRERGEIGHLWPRFLPDGRNFLYFVASNEDTIRGIYAASLSDPRGRRVVASSASGQFGNGHLLYLLGERLVAQRFDVDELAVKGRPIPVIDSVATTLYAFQGAFSLSTNGVLAYSSGLSKDATRLAWLDREGRTLEIVAPPGHHRHPALSPDGRYLAFEAYDGTSVRVLVQDLATGRSQPAIDVAERVKHPVWAPNSITLALSSERPGGWALRHVTLDRPGSATMLVETGAAKLPSDWSPDGERLVYAELTERGDYDILAVPVDGSGAPAPLVASPDQEFGARFSPAGDLIAYVSNRSGRYEIYVEPFPPNGLRCQVSSGGGYDPQWGSSEMLHYLTAAGTLMAVDVQVGERCETGTPRSLFDTPIETPGTARNHYATVPGESRFLFNLPAVDFQAQTVSVLINWPALLRVEGT